MASRTRDEPVSSILDAMANSGDEPDKESSMAILSSFDNLNEEEKDTVVQDPNFWDSLEKWSTEEVREEKIRSGVESLKRHLEEVVNNPSIGESAAYKVDAARLLAAIKEGQRFEWFRALLCNENSGNDYAAGQTRSKRKRIQ